MHSIPVNRAGSHVASGGCYAAAVPNFKRDYRPPADQARDAAHRRQEYAFKMCFSSSPSPLVNNYLTAISLLILK